MGETAELRDVMPNLHDYILGRSSLALRKIGYAPPNDFDKIQIAVKVGEGSVSFDAESNTIQLEAPENLSYATLEARYGSVMTQEILAKLDQATKIRWGDAPRRQHLQDAAKLARRYKIPSGTFKNAPKVVWVHPMNMKRRLEMKPAEWIYSKKMPAQDDVHIIHDGDSDAIEELRALRVSKKDPMAPVILVESPSGAWMIADGSHRVHLATKSNQPFRACVYKSDTEWKNG